MYLKSRKGPIRIHHRIARRRDLVFMEPEWSRERMKTRRAAPKASTLVESMRDIGYSLETALADIIDNSIAAGASSINLFAEIGDTLPKRDLDNGCGMSEAELFNAMRPGGRVLRGTGRNDRDDSASD